MADVNIHKSICPECSYDITLQAKFCRSCGTSFRNSYRLKKAFFRKKIRKHGEYNWPQIILGAVKSIFWLLIIVGSLFLLYSAVVDYNSTPYPFTT